MVRLSRSTSTTRGAVYILPSRLYGRICARTAGVAVTVVAVLSLVGEDAAAKGAKPTPILGIESVIKSKHWLGDSVAIDGDLVVAGDLGEAAYSFGRVDGVWGELGVLAGSDAVPGDYFGSPVAARNGTVAVSGYHHAGGGAVYVFSQGETGWREERILAPPPTPAGFSNSEFGLTVAVGSDFVVASSPLKRAPGETLASVHVFTRDGADWNHEELLNPGASEDFGFALAARDARIVVGARFVRAAYVFERVDGSWRLDGELLAPELEDVDEYGEAVALGNDFVVVGAGSRELASGDRPGAAFVFRRTGEIWALETELQPSDPVDRGRFGYSVAADGDMIAVGAPAPSLSGGKPIICIWPCIPGAVYIFRHEDGAWHEKAKLIASDARDNDTLSLGLDMSGMTVVASHGGGDHVHAFDLVSGDLGPGAECRSDSQCVSGYCVGGACCESSCADGACVNGSCVAAPCADSTCGDASDDRGSDGCSVTSAPGSTDPWVLTALLCLRWLRRRRPGGG